MLLFSFSFKHDIFPLSIPYRFPKRFRIKTFLRNVRKSLIKIYEGGFLLCVWGFVLFAASDTYSMILETSGLGITLFLSQNKDSVNTKCKVELREVLQRVV